MKWSGGPIVAQGRVSGFRQIENYSPEQLKQTTAGFSLFDLAEYWTSRPTSFFGMSIYLTDEKWLDNLIFTCVYCGASGLGVKHTVDHREPFSKGGKTDYDNLVTACWECNIGKGAKLL